MKKYLFIIIFLLIPYICKADSEVTIGGHTGTAKIWQDEGNSLRPRPYVDVSGDSVRAYDDGGKTILNVVETDPVYSAINWSTQVPTYETDPNALLLDQTTPQTIINGIPSYESSHGPFTDEHMLVDKEYVDGVLIGIGTTFYMLDAADGTVATYKQASITASELSTASVGASANSATDTLIEEWISPAGMDWEILNEGVYNLNVFAARTGGRRDVRIFWRFYERKTDTSEVLIATSNLGDVITDSETRYRIFCTLEEDYTPSADSRLVGKVYMRTSATPSNSTTCTLYYQGDEDSHWQVPINQEFLNSNYLNKATYDTDANDIVDSAESVDASGINWTDFEEIPADGINWTDLYIPDTSVNWDAETDPIYSAVNWTTQVPIYEQDLAHDTAPIKYSIGIESPVATDDKFFGEVAFGTETYTSIYCKTEVDNVTLDITVGGSAINGGNITCTTSGVLDDSLGGDTSGSVGEEIKLAIDAVAGAETYLMVILNGTVATQ